MENVLDSFHITSCSGVRFASLADCTRFCTNSVNKSESEEDSGVFDNKVPDVERVRREAMASTCVVLALWNTWPRHRWTPRCSRTLPDRWLIQGASVICCLLVDTVTSCVLELSLSFLPLLLLLFYILINQCVLFYYFLLSWTLCRLLLLLFILVYQVLVSSFSYCQYLILLYLFLDYCDSYLSVSVAH